jgi:hypothetical protein
MWPMPLTWSEYATTRKHNVQQLGQLSFHIMVTHNPFQPKKSPWVIAQWKLVWPRPLVWSEFPHFDHPQPFGKKRASGDQHVETWPNCCALCSHVGALRTQTKPKVVAQLCPQFDNPQPFGKGCGWSKRGSSVGQSCCALCSRVAALRTQTEPQALAARVSTL